MNKKEMIIQNISDSIDTKKKILQDEEFIEKIENVADVCVDAYLSGNKLLMCGNGGSASDAQHMAGELVGRYMMERKEFRQLRSMPTLRYLRHLVMITIMILYMRSR